MLKKNINNIRERLGRALPNFLFIGDPHRETKFITRLIDEHQPDAIFILGDIELTGKQPLNTLLAKPWSEGKVWFVHGDHDTENEVVYKNLLGTDALKERNLHGKIVEVNGVKLAGLGGKFDEKIWLGNANNEKHFQSIDDWIKEPSHKQWLPDESAEIKKRMYYEGVNFPQTLEELTLEMAEKGPADILITHYPPWCHPHGGQAVDTLAELLEVSMVFHGHTHDTPDYSVCNVPYEVHGAGFRGCVDITGKTIKPGEQDGNKNHGRQDKLRIYPY